VSPDHEYVIYGTESDFPFFLALFGGQSTSFSKCSMKMFAITGEMGDPIAAPEVLFIELVVIREVIVRQCSIKGIRLEGTSCDVLNMLSVFDWDLCEEGFYIEAH